MTIEARRIVLQNAFSDLPRVHAAMKSWLDDLGAGPNLRFDAALVIEEIVTNLVKYAWPEGGEHRIALDLDEEEGRLVLHFEDDGVPFDPNSAPVHEFANSIELRRPGGLGLHLIRLAADRIEYRTGDGINHLTIRLREPLGPP